MRKKWIAIGLSIGILTGCNRIKIEEIPCPSKDATFCGERVKRLVDNEWILDGWEIDNSGSEGTRYSFYRAGELIYSEGKPTHAKWFTETRIKDYKLRVLEIDSVEKTILINAANKEVLYQLNFSQNNLEYIFKIPQHLDSVSDTLYQLK